MDELIEELKSRRIAQGLTIQDLFQRTRINAEFLEALEAGKFDVLPEAYIKLFLKRYAQEVRLDGEEIVRRFEQHQWKARAATESVHRQQNDGTPGWVIGAGGALVIGVVAAVVAWQSTPSDGPSASTVREATSTSRITVVAPARVQTKPSDRNENPSSTRPATVSKPVDPILTTPPLERDVPAVESPVDPLDTADGIVPESVPDPDPESTPQSTPESDQQPPEAAQVVGASESQSPPPSDESSPAAAPAVNVEPEDAIEAERVVSAYSLSLKQDLSTSTGGLTLSAVGLEPTQVVVTSDGEPVFSGLVGAGRRVSWEARDRFSIEIQKGPDLRLQIQDEILPVVGAEGRQVRLYISRFSIWVEEIENPELAASPDTTP